MRIVNFPRFILSLSIVVFVLSFIMSMTTKTVFSAEISDYNEVIVARGDTLWTIASELEGNTNKNIYEIKRVNNLSDSIIYEGQVLMIPKK